MRTRLAVMLAALAAAGLDVRAEPLVLDTPGYRVEIDDRCPEGTVSCADVHYRALDRKTGRTITLRGSTHHTLCADGVTPCRFLGYRFRRGEQRHYVAESGHLTITRAGRVVVSEAGVWE